MFCDDRQSLLEDRDGRIAGERGFFSVLLTDKDWIQNLLRDELKSLLLALNLSGKGPPRILSADDS